MQLTGHSVDGGDETPRDESDAHSEREAASLEPLIRQYVDDGRSEEAFSDLAAWAAQICGRRAAFISLVGEHRQWVKAAYGVAFVEAPPTMALCAQTLIEPSGILLVPDVLADQRFADNPFVVSDSRIRGYAGVVLEGNGRRLGTISVVDDVPFTLTSAHVDSLTRLSRQAVSEMRHSEASTRLTADAEKHQRAERELAESKRLYCHLVQNTFGIVWTLALDGTVTMVNDGAVELLGYSREEFVGATLKAFVPPEHHEAVERYLLHLHHAPTANGVLVLTRRDGRQAELAFQSFRFDSPDGPYIVGHGIDISERRRALAALQKSEQRLHRVVESIQEVIFETDEDARWTYLNKAWTEITGFTVEESLQRAFFEFVHPDDVELNRQQFQPLARRETDVLRYETRCVTKEGDVRWIEVHARLVLGAHDRIVGTTGTLRDVTRNHLLAEELVTAREAALASSRLKSEFVAKVSHEVRTPINGVIGLAVLLCDTPLSPEQRSYVGGISRSAETLLAIVNDILDFSKIEAGKLAVEAVAFELKVAVAAAVESVKGEARRKGLLFEVEYGPALPEYVVGDPVRLGQVLTNLADNAVKFTERGRVSIWIDGAILHEGVSTVHFEVRDTGIGIPSDKLQVIFDGFTQGDNSTARRYGGSGLGLTISGQLVEMMGGHITVTSTVGCGSIFSFALQVHTARREDIARTNTLDNAPVGEGRALHALLAEDNEVNQLVARQYLQKAGCTVETVATGDAAVLAVARRPFDVVFMDCQMPGMDGYEATARIRVMPGCADLPIVAMTAHAMRGDRERCLAAGMTDYVAKPIRPETVGAALERVRQGGRICQRSGVRADAQVAFSRQHVLDMLGGDVEAARELIALLTRDVPSCVSALLDRARAGDLTATARLAHKVTGAVGNVAASTVGEIAGTIEQLAKRGDAELMAAKCAALEGATAELMEDLDVWRRELSGC
jgi:PAS domain S-box-containing protein